MYSSNPSMRLCRAQTPLVSGNISAREFLVETNHPAKIPTSPLFFLASADPTYDTLCTKSEIVGWAEELASDHSLPVIKNVESFTEFKRSDDIHAEFGLKREQLKGGTQVTTLKNLYSKICNKNQTANIIITTVQETYEQ
ncbi:hypothetical protein TURU_030721 [Turdus rufiventris]|nr:hypothetical protein TURU_030721 [Turdus rufiventris]